MATKLTMHKVQNTIAAGQTSGTTYSGIIKGKIVAVKTVYSHTTPASTSDRDVNVFEMNPADNDDLSDVLQEILNIGGLGADPEADNAVYYPETTAQDNTGTAIDLSDAQGGNTAKYTPFVVFGRVMLSVTAAVAGDITTVYLVVEEY